MSGHNKWSKIKRAKGAADAKRSKQYSKILKEVAVAVREGGPDPDSNPRLRLLVQNARGCNMPKDTLSRAINKASDKDAAVLQELTFESITASPFSSSACRITTTAPLPTSSRL